MARKRNKSKKGRLTVVLALVAVALVYTFGKQQKPVTAEEGSTHSEQTVSVSESPSSSTKQRKEARRKGIEIPAYLTDRDEEIVQHTGFTLSYNKSRLLPNWVAWVLSDERTRGTLKRYDDFQPDEGIKARPIAYDADYRGSGYDRGHQCPSADCKHDPEAMRQCFLLSNICPQTHALNAGDWEDLEKLCRQWAQAYDSIYIVCGPIIEKGVTYDRIGSSGVTVPRQFYKVVLRWDGSGEAEAIGFIFDNDDSRQPLRQHAVTVDSVERRTGIDFFSKLPKRVEQRAEARYDCDRWQKL